MSLIAENIETKEGIFSHTIFRDIARMDKAQLSRYVRLAFTGEPDYQFLPRPFWDYWFDVQTHGRSLDGRTPPSPAEFFSSLHNLLGSVARGTFQVGFDGDPAPNFGFRARYREVIIDLLNEAVNLEGEPDADQKKLASFAVEAVGSLRSKRDFMIDTLYRYREAEGDPEKLKKIKFPDELVDDLEKLDKDYEFMLTRSYQLINSGNFGQLKFEYEYYESLV